MSEQLLTLAVPAGAEGYAVSHGTRQFPPYRPSVDGPWLVDVTPEAAASLMHVGGFGMVSTSEPIMVPRGFAVVRHQSDPRATTGVGTPDGHGNFIVPTALVDQLRGHGFQPLESTEAPPEADAIERIVELEDRLHNAGTAAAQIAQDRDALAAQVAELQAKLAALAEAKTPEAKVEEPKEKEPKVEEPHAAAAPAGAPAAAAAAKPAEKPAAR